MRNMTEKVTNILLISFQLSSNKERNDLYNPKRTVRERLLPVTRAPQVLMVFEIVTETRSFRSHPNE